MKWSWKLILFFSFLNIHVVVVFVEPINPPLLRPAPPAPLTYGDTYNYPIFFGLYLFWSRSYKNVLLLTPGEVPNYFIPTNCQIRPCCCHLLQLLYICCCSTFAASAFLIVLFVEKKKIVEVLCPPPPWCLWSEIRQFQTNNCFKVIYLFIFFEWPLLIFTTLNPKTIKP